MFSLHSTRRFDEQNVTATARAVKKLNKYQNHRDVLEIAQYLLSVSEEYAPGTYVGVIGAIIVIGESTLNAGGPYVKMGIDPSIRDV